MADLTGDISNKTFRRTDATPQGQVSIDGKTLEILLLLDGQTNLRGISQKAALNLSDLRPILTKLLENGLIEETHEQIPMLDPQFYSFMAAQLSQITGPIAKVIVEDAVLEIGDGSLEVAKNRADEVIDLVGRQIPDDKKRAEFIKNMLQKLQEM